VKCSRRATLQQLMANMRAAVRAVEPASEQSGDTAGLRPPQRHVAITFRGESLPFPPIDSRVPGLPFNPTACPCAFSARIHGVRRRH
jgi:hypothetical protein